MNNFRKKALPAFILLAGASMSLAGITYAWFTNSNKAEISNIHVDVTGDAGGINISTVRQGTYSEKIDMGSVATTTLSPISTVKSVTKAATGQPSLFNFFKANLSSSTTIGSTEKITVDATNPAPYLLLPVYFENTNESPVDLYFNYRQNEDIFKTRASTDNKEASQALRVGVIKQGTLKNTIVDEEYGNVAAEDIHIFEVDATNHQDGVGIYKKTGETSYADSPTTYNYTTSVADGTNIQQPYWGLKAATTFSTAVPVTYSPSKTFAEGDEQFSAMEKVIGELQSEYNGYQDASGTTTSTTAPDDAKSLCQLGRGITRVDFVVWLEGQDVDCINAISADQLDINLKFCSYVTPTSD